MNTKVVTGIIKLAYVHIFEPYSIVESVEPRYSTTIIISKCDAETLEPINRFIEEVNRYCNIKTLLRDGDLERPEDPLYKFSYFLNVNSKNKPGIVDSNVNTIIEPIEVKNGSYAKVSFNLYTYDSNSNKGIAASLNNIQLIEGFPLISCRNCVY
ncbi:DUF2815 family protein [Clostridium chromiireducens]|uniref:DUF2815 family protein n=1 Tax=Clostridium chromiireducens TaxID=225345 RepID=A0A964RNW5_9CLOT|nr:DUF2815 family protein [Clostridium chromiireducens]MVX64935.1 DUF2815 family protein [Clostridium chromiireducens]